jgi:DNA-binding transcriptional LysR family regulator
MASGFLRELIEVYAARHPDVAIQIQEGTSAEHIDLVRRRQLDVAFVMDATGAPDCDVAPMWSERVFAVLPRSHPLCDQKAIEWAALRGQRLIARKSECNPTLCELVIKRLTDRDHRPEVQKLNVSRGTLIHLVGLGMGVGLTSEATVGTPFSDVEFRPIAGDDAPLQFNAVWLSNNDNPALRRFLSLARAHAKQRRNVSGGGPTGGTPTEQC